MFVWYHVLALSSPEPLGVAALALERPLVAVAVELTPAKVVGDGRADVETAGGSISNEVAADSPPQRVTWKSEDGGSKDFTLCPTKRGSANHAY